MEMDPPSIHDASHPPPSLQPTVPAVGSVCNSLEKSMMLVAFYFFP